MAKVSDTTQLNTSTQTQGDQGGLKDTMTVEAPVQKPMVPPPATPQVPEVPQDKGLVIGQQQISKTQEAGVQQQVQKTPYEELKKQAQLPKDADGSIGVLKTKAIEAGLDQKFADEAMQAYMSGTLLDNEIKNYYNKAIAKGAKPATEETPNLNTPQDAKSFLDEQITTAENFQDKMTDELGAYKNASIAAEADYKEQITKSAEEKYQAEQDILNQYEQLYQTTLQNKNAVAEDASIAKKMAAELAYKNALAEYDVQKAKVQKAFEDQLFEQEQSNKKKQLELESAIAAFGGFGSLNKNKEIIDLTLKADKLINDIKFESAQADIQFANLYNSINQQYKNDLFAIETEKEAVVTENYNQYLTYVTDIKADKQMSLVEKNNAINEAAAEYKKNVAAINAAAFETKYEMAVQTANQILQLQLMKYEQIQAEEMARTMADQPLSESVGYLVNSYGEAITDENGEIIPTGSSSKYQKIEQINPFTGETSVIGFFDPSTGATVYYGGQGASIGYGNQSVLPNPYQSVGFSSQYQPVGAGGHLSTPFVSGTITGYGSYTEDGKPIWEYGLDVANTLGTPIVSGLPGKVVSVVSNYHSTDKPKGEAGGAENGGFGNQVKVKYEDGTTIWFSHLDTVNVTEGQDIAAGMILGGMGNTGKTYGNTGIHVDITGIKANGTKMTAKEVEAFLQTGGGMGAGLQQGQQQQQGGQGNIIQFVSEAAKAELSESEKQTYIALRSQGVPIQDAMSKDQYQKYLGKEKGDTDKVQQAAIVSSNIIELSKLLDEIPAPDPGITGVGDKATLFINKWLQNQGAGQTAETYTSLSNGLAFALVKMLGSVGAQSDKDREVANKLLPSIYDTQSVRDQKLKFIKFISDNYQNYTNNDPDQSVIPNLYQAMNDAGVNIGTAPSSVTAQDFLSE